MKRDRAVEILKGIKEMFLDDENFELELDEPDYDAIHDFEECMEALRMSIAVLIGLKNQHPYVRKELDAAIVVCEEKARSEDLFTFYRDEIERLNAEINNLNARKEKAKNGQGLLG